MNAHYNAKIKNIEERNESNIEQLNSSFQTDKDKLILGHQKEIQAINYKFNTSITCDN